MNENIIVWLDKVGVNDVAIVGGKNASLGEMIKNLVPKGINVPGGFAVTSEAYRQFLRETGLGDKIKEILKGLDTKNLPDLARRGKIIRELFLKARMPDLLQGAIADAYKKMEMQYGNGVSVAVRSSATAEDLPDASFAGEHETYLNIVGANEVIEAAKAAFGSLFTDRAISYRTDKGFDQLGVALSVGVQKMVRSDLGSSGVMFTVDTESGFRDLVIINGSWGLGELVVQGQVTPDEFLVYKKCLDGHHAPIIGKSLGTKLQKMIYSSKKKGVIQTKRKETSKSEQESFVLSDKEILKLAEWGIAIEKHYSEVRNRWTPMDMEWAKDGETGELYIVQARPETVQARRDYSKIIEYRRKGEEKILASGVSVGSKIATGKARVILNTKDIEEFRAGEILITEMTDPDWEPIMKIAAGIVTDKGGRTSHAAIVSRELGIPAVVGSGDATKKIKTGADIAIDTTGTTGAVYDGIIPFETIEHDAKKIPTLKTKIMVNIAAPDRAFEVSFLPVTGVGLAREEFIIASSIGIHPEALLDYNNLPAPLKKKIDEKTRGYDDKVEFYVDNLAFGIATIAAAFNPRPVIVRFSDFKTNEYRTLIGGDRYEPEEENPMIGWRGASRYSDPRFKESFKLEVLAIKKVREKMGLLNVIPMVPFCRTLEEGRETLKIMKENGLIPKMLGGDCLTYVMCEIPSNIVLADEFLKLFDGMSIGSNDLTQLTLGLDRDAGALAHLGNENNPAVRALIKTVIEKCVAAGKYIGICGQGPSDIPDFAAFLVENGIESMSLNPDSVIKTIFDLAVIEEKMANAKKS